MPQNLIDEVVSASSNRRSFLKTIAAATAGVGALSMVGLSTAEAQTSTEVEVLKFALNLEYLEAEFYTWAIYGHGIEKFGFGITGEANGSNPAEGGTTTGGKKVYFDGNVTTGLSSELAAEIGGDERAHVGLLRSALGSHGSWQDMKGNWQEGNYDCNPSWMPSQGSCLKVSSRTRRRRCRTLKDNYPSPTEDKYRSPTAGRVTRCN
jgi:hypothetical protein